MKLLRGICAALAMVSYGHTLRAQGVVVSEVGHIGVYADPAGTTTCATIEVGTYGTLYVLATPAGPTADGIAGAEFRVEVRSPEGWSLSFQPATATIVIGDPIDTHPGDLSDASGTTLVFPVCQAPDPVTGKVLIGTILAANLGGAPTDLWLKRRTNPSNEMYPCALLLQCNVPQYYKWCVPAHIPPSCTQAGPPSIPVEDCDRDPALFVAAINKEVEPPPLPDRAPSEPFREVIAMLSRRTTIDFPPGRTYAPLDETRILVPEIEVVLRRHAVQVVSKGFPCFDLADTLHTTRDGRTVRLTDWSTVFKFLLPIGGNPKQLAADLELTPGVVFAEPNGGAVVDLESSFSTPNPLKPGAVMAIDLAVPARVTLDLYDVAGRRVRRLQDGTLSAGPHRLDWNGQDQSGRALPRGVYILRLTWAGNTSTRKVVVLD